MENLASVLAIAVLLMMLVCTAGHLTCRAHLCQLKDKASKPGEDDHFIAKPYLQLGDASQQYERESVEIMWLSRKRHHDWSLEYRPKGALLWRPAHKLDMQLIALSGYKPRRRYNGLIRGLKPGQEFDYRVRRSGRIVFSARAVPRKSASQAYRFVVLGDHASGRAGHRKVAYQVFQDKPDFVMIAGDVAYKHGRVSEYLEKYFPVDNSDKAGPDTGAPLLRSRLFLSAFGNHDMGTPELTDLRDLDKYPDLLANFTLWSQPLNGPLGTVGSANTPLLVGSHNNQAAFLSAAGKKFPRMANYSFDYANSHWTVLDANVYMDWTDAQLRSWVENDIKTSAATWKFICFHQPPFSTDVKHANEQRMRVLSDIFERSGVDLVFCGHHHAYERTRPLRFKVTPQPDGRLMSPEGQVPGEFSVDQQFDGLTNTHPDGVIYIVSGGGGGKLNSGKDLPDQEHLPPFLFKLVDNLHSFTTCDVDGRTLTLRQISEDGTEIDRVVVTK